MTSPKNRPLARHLQVPVDEARIERGWRAVEARLPTRPEKHLPRALAMGMVMATLAFALLLFVLPLRFTREAVIEGAVLASSETERETIELVDGSRLVLEPATRLRLVHVSAREVRLSLEQGVLDAFVTHVDGRPFTVVAGNIEVSVIGTRFRVSLDEADVGVAVEEGRVALRGPNVPKTLGAGESWSSTIAPSLETPEPTAPLEPPQDLDAGAPLPAQRGSSRALPSRFHSLYGAGRYDDAYASVEPSRFQRCIEIGSARDLFALASAARLSGHSRPAARAFDALRRRHREDARAGLAALELGRLRLYDLDDPSGAAEAFDDAIVLQPSAFYREDAEARRVQALEAAGQQDACIEARDAYLVRFPSGLHATTVARRCR